MLPAHHTTADDGDVSDEAWLTVDALAAASPTPPVALLDVESLGSQPSQDEVSAAAATVTQSDLVVIARCKVSQVEALRTVAAACTTTLVSAPLTAALPAEFVPVDDVDQAAKVVTEAVAATPNAALVLAGLLRATTNLDVRSGLYAESAAYSMLLAGGEFAAWRSSHPARRPTAPTEDAVTVERTGDDLAVMLNRPDRHNAFDRWVRDATCDALDVARLDPSVASVRLAGAGASFCSGGDLDEFATQSDVVLGHLIRLDRSVGWRLHQLADRVVAELHGACIGAGIELPAFAGRVVARDDTWIQLPELRMGLIPGAGGTVSLPRRIGRWRTAWLAFSGARVDVATAHQWGLVDDRVG